MCYFIIDITPHAVAGNFCKFVTQFFSLAVSLPFGSDKSTARGNSVWCAGDLLCNIDFSGANSREYNINIIYVYNTDMTLTTQI